MISQKLSTQGAFDIPSPGGEEVVMPREVGI